jgi:hypothetical protein
MPLCSSLTVPTRFSSRASRIHLRENIEAQGLSASRPVDKVGGPEGVQVRMMAFAIDRSRTIISAMILGRRVTAQDVAWLKREVFADRDVSRESADELFAVVRAEMDNAPEWKEFFVDMIAEHVVRQAEPPGVVSDERAVWLLARVDECKSVEALAALVNVCAEAHRAPDWFVNAVKERAARGPGAAGFRATAR